MNHASAPRPVAEVGVAAGAGAVGLKLRQAPPIYNEMPTCAVLAGNLFNDDLILSVAHLFQVNTDVHTRRPRI